MDGEHHPLTIQCRIGNVKKSSMVVCEYALRFCNPRPTTALGYPYHHPSVSTKGIEQRLTQIPGTSLPVPIADLFKPRSIRVAIAALPGNARCSEVDSFTTSHLGSGCALYILPHGTSESTTSPSYLLPGTLRVSPRSEKIRDPGIPGCAKIPIFTSSSRLDARCRVSPSRSHQMWKSTKLVESF